MSPNYKITTIESSEIKEIFSPQCLEFVVELQIYLTPKEIFFLKKEKIFKRK